MKKLFFVFLVLTAVFTGCKKDDPEPVLDRAKFIGSWTGTTTIVSRIDGELVDTDTQAVTIKLDAGADNDQILIDKNTEDELKCSVTGSTFKIKEQSKYAHFEDGTIIQVAVSGNGTLSSNGILTISASLEGDYEGMILTQIITQTLNKN